MQTLVLQFYLDKNVISVAV